jgi:sugar transferase (PEP-CTERM/EpsH1 system associated)
VTDDPRPLVLHVIHHLVTGGMENGLVNLIGRLPQALFRHAVACIEDHSMFRQRLTRRDVEVFALHRSRAGIWRVRRQIYVLCRRLRPAIVHTRNLSGLDALLPARLAGVPRLVHGEHGWDVDDLHGDKLRPALLRRLHSPLVDQYVTVSNDLRRYLIERIGITPLRVTAICNGVDITRFAPGVERRADLLPADWRALSPLVIGTIGRIQPVKDQATLVRAFARLVADRPALRSRVRLAIVGDGPLLPALRELAHTLGVDDIAWFPGALDNIPEVLHLFDVFILPSLNEGISNTLLEALASGVPVIATRVGGNVEIVDEGCTGRLFNSGDVAALADLLGEYSDNPGLRTAHGLAARAAATRRFSLDAMVDKYRTVYESLLLRDSKVRVT